MSVQLQVSTGPSHGLDQTNIHNQISKYTHTSFYYTAKCRLLEKLEHILILRHSFVLEPALYPGVSAGACPRAHWATGRKYRSPRRTHIHTYKKFRVSCRPNTWEETGELRKPHMGKRRTCEWCSEPETENFFFLAVKRQQCPAICGAAQAALQHPNFRFPEWTRR